MMTGFSVDELIKQATDNGAVDALQKPLTPKSIVEALDSVAPSGIILVADDDENFGPMLKQIICDDGRSCELVTNGSLAIDRMGQGGIDSVILDLRMPLIDGLDVYKHLRGSGIDVPTILITAYAEEYLDKINAEVDLDLTGILTKPFEPDDLLNKLSVSCRQAETLLQSGPACLEPRNNWPNGGITMATEDCASEQKKELLSKAVNITWTPDLEPPSEIRVESLRHRGVDRLRLAFGHKKCDRFFWAKWFHFGPLRDQRRQTAL